MTSNALAHIVMHMTKVLSPSTHINYQLYSTHSHNLINRVETKYNGIFGKLRKCFGCQPCRFLSHFMYERWYCQKFHSNTTCVLCMIAFLQIPEIWNRCTERKEWLFFYTPTLIIWLLSACAQVGESNDMLPIPIQRRDAKRFQLFDVVCVLSTQRKLVQNNTKI